MDYAFMGQEGQEGLTKILVVKDRKMKNIFSHPVRAKGTAAESWIAGRICKDIRGMGYNRIVLKCDQEPSIVENPERSHPQKRSGDDPRKFSERRVAEQWRH